MLRIFSHCLWRRRSQGWQAKRAILRLVLGGGGDLAFDGEMAEERFNLGIGHFPGVPLVVEEDEAFDPIDVGVFGADAVVEDPGVLADLVEQFCFWLLGWGGVGYGRIPRN